MRIRFTVVGRVIVWLVLTSILSTTMTVFAAELEGTTSAATDTSLSSTTTHSFPFNFGLRGFMLPGAGFVGGFGLGLDVSYSIIPNLALGLSTHSTGL